MSFLSWDTIVWGFKKEKKEWLYVFYDYNHSYNFYHSQSKHIVLLSPD